MDSLASLSRECREKVILRAWACRPSQVSTSSSFCAKAPAPCQLSENEEVQKLLQGGKPAVQMENNADILRPHAWHFRLPISVPLSPSVSATQTTAENLTLCARLLLSLCCKHCIMVELLAEREKMKDASEWFFLSKCKEEPWYAERFSCVRLQNQNHTSFSHIICFSLENMDG